VGYIFFCSIHKNSTNVHSPYSGINADQMEVTGGRLCKVSNITATTSRLTAPLTDSKNMANLLNKVLLGASEIINGFPQAGTMIGMQSK
jgi:hypothetical protein